MSKYIRVEIHFNTRRMQEDEVYYFEADGTVVPLLPLEEFQKFKGSEVNMLHWNLNTKGVEFSNEYVI